MANELVKKFQPLKGLILTTFVVTPFAAYLEFQPLKGLILTVLLPSLTYLFNKISTP